MDLSQKTKKKEYLEIVRAFELVGDHKTDLDAIKAHIAAWKEFGKVVTLIIPI